MDDHAHRWIALKGVLALGGTVGIGLLARRMALPIVGDSTPAVAPTSLGLLLGLSALGLVLWIACFGLEWWFVRRKSLFSRLNSLVLVFIGLVYVIYGFLLIPFLQEAAISQWGQATPATVTEKRTALRYDSDTGITHTDYFLRYRYTLPQRPAPYDGQSGVKKSYFDRTTEDDTITIYYWPWLPAWSELEAAQSAQARFPFLLTASFTLIGWTVAVGIVVLVLGPI
ncbi:DUF3592 domain-containing protein [Phormidium sp. FACHB-1136]|uniref:DUF3592 domain-containing protein n=1 Tax=Phormidium sp. FACHB-1136 TaxID=2692848 RepID=UPI001682EDEF|nr:DUF3592 domain-containing protein [Phormidium sp. FACHB-1136]MBD2424864.1 DUF3592 domain-containing protein [Phormidium sp. FACHB-1136]